MNIIERANEKSTLQKLLSSKSINPYIYRYETNFSDGIKNTCYVPCESIETPTYGDKIYFHVPKYGNLVKAIIETTITSTQDITQFQDRPGQRIFEWIELQTIDGSRTIQKETADYITLRTDCLDDATSSRMGIVMSPDKELPIVAGTSFIVYTPFYGFFSEHPSKFIDTDFCEPLQIVGKVNSSASKIGFNGTLSFSFRIHLTFFTTQLNKEINPYRYPLTFVTVNEFEELPTTIATGSTSTIVNIKTDKSVMATHFLLKNDNQDIFNINTIKMKVDGKTFYENSNRLSLIDYGWLGDSNFDLDVVRPAKNNGERFFSIYWSMYPDRNYNTLCINFKDLGSVDAELTFDALDDDYDLIIIHEFFDLTTINRNGVFERDLIN